MQQWKDTHFKVMQEVRQIEEALHAKREEARRQKELANLGNQDEDDNDMAAKNDRSLSPEMQKQKRENAIKKYNFTKLIENAEKFMVMAQEAQKK